LLPQSAYSLPRHYCFAFPATDWLYRFRLAFGLFRCRLFSRAFLLFVGPCGFLGRGFRRLRHGLWLRFWLGGRLNCWLRLFYNRRWLRIGGSSDSDSTFRCCFKIV
jgi:hypothetical protein